ncbi:sulfate ABC transporter permease subunit CysW [Clostridium cylindrosporum]|uniref:Sulfate transport system permease protein CysW n=1 Tax=Clostridium cylindrosporum DSM 605 TaxID=1121307 RepID=A0A0J8D9F3_CLOCY|nr:sulfate ABC transporter permease subunit CysW [Clostridium cylindrosporum]KMT20954.1 sulfate transport system permease protein CysW [Clostridium cylindrosporum DSM 605]
MSTKIEIRNEKNYNKKPILKLVKEYLSSISIAKITLTAIALIYVFAVLILPLVAVFVKGLEKGYSVYIASITDPIALDAIKLTLKAILIAVPLNTVFGIVAAWLISKFEFKGKNILITIIDMPFAISPVIAGFVFVLLFSDTHGLFGEILTKYDMQIIFNTPGIIIATVFVTFPFVARELIPIMQSKGSSEEEAALTLGASGLKTFFKITLPNIKWALLYGVILTAARAAGEFGAVSVVSGHIRGLTTTLPLHIEILYNEYQFSAAFAVASLLTIIALINLIAKSVIEWKIKKESINEEVE